MKSLVSAIAILAFTASSGMACEWFKSETVADADKGMKTEQTVKAGADRTTGEATGTSRDLRTGDQLAKTPASDNDTDAGGSDR